ncbi:hypothetical protein [Novosphingobium cyanobacteriorum]|uniref:DUF1488 domain-containing protein n=1 Tax=Novosphingobium cyanobacteriorum TaxID=3024215 RepID=A0ABT6CNE4_9SPHN|nr:hypothetical protein [Novosphingobium cyanobacteriorum]MDF8335093.1 hypothetical protein [Novosphingobium cyanobacteriorum]
MNLYPIPGGFRSQLYLLPQGFIISFEVAGGVLSCEWWPREPSRSEMRAMLENYRAARGDFLALTGLRTVVIEAFERGEGDALH